MSKETNLYEIGYLLRIDLKEEEVLSFSEKIRNTISEKGGLVVSEGKNKKIALAYPIKKETDAFFNWVKFSVSTDKSSVIEIKNFLDKQSEVLRFLVIKTSEEQKKTVKFKKTPTADTENENNEDKKEEAEPIEEKKEEEKEKEIDKKIEEILGE